MPQMSTILSGAASLGVLAGIVSGIFYLVITGLRWAGRLRAALQEEEVRRQNGIPPGSCVICGRPSDSLDTGPDPVGCSDCGGRACKGDGCSRRSSIGWRCVLCHVKRDLKKTSGNWFNQKTPTSPEAIESIENEKSIDSETIQVREFIEKLVEVIVGGPLDRVTVGKLSTHSAYLGMFAKYHESLCQGLARLGFALQLSIANKHGCDFDSPSSAHAALKHLIEKIVNEAMTLPNLKEALHSSPNGIVNEDEDFTNKTYEDILATAILNKVIERFQQQNGRRYETIDKNSNLVTESNCGGSGRSNSIHDDDLHSHSDWSDTSRTEPLSLTIEEHIEEVTTTYESSEEDDRQDITEVDTELKVNRRVPFPESGRVILDGTDEENSESDELQSSVTELVTSTNSWEENWLFQKKRLRSTPSAHHPVPVPMLVPNPSQEFRALIGGVDADDLSDMSECSDSVLEDVVEGDNNDDPNLTNQIVDALNDDTEESNSKDEKEELEQIKTDDGNVKEEMNEKQEQNEEGEMVKKEIQQQSTDSSEQVNGYVDTDDEYNGTTPLDSLNSESSPQSLSQKDRECSVDYERIHQIDVPISKTPVPKPRNLELINNEKPLLEKPPKCPIAEREKEKWKHAIELPNNPYSPENIAKREQQRKNDFFRCRYGSLETIDFPDEINMDDFKDDSDTPRYNRDYFVKASRSPTGDPSIRSSSSISQLSETSEENISTESKTNGENNSSDSKLTENKIKIHEHQPQEMKPNKDIRVLVRSHAVDKTDITLPSVKELAKQFTKVESKPPQPKARWKPPQKTSQDNGDYSPKHSESSNSSDHADNSYSSDTRDAREEEVDYSIVPVSEIISNLLKNKNEENSRKIKEKISASHIKENGVSKPDLTASEPVIHMVRFNGKQVHSLTARSISKEFREGLKKNSTYHRLVKIDRGSSGESDHGEIYSATDPNRPPTPPIDLKSKKKFWEDIISNSSK